MSRENLDNDLLKQDAELRRELKKLARDEQKRNAANKQQVHEIDTRTGNSKDAADSSPYVRQKKTEASWGFKIWRRHQKRVLIGTSMLLVFGFTGNYVWSWLRHDSLVQEGRELFLHEWQANDPKAHSGDGLGPVFNANSCVACHFQGGVGGAGPNNKNVNTFEVLPFNDQKELVSGVVHAAATIPTFLETPKTLTDVFPIIKGVTVTRGGCSYRIPDFNPVRTQMVSTPPLFGSGLIDSLSLVSIEYNYAKNGINAIVKEMDPEYNGPSLGRVRILADGRVGKFGWKAQFASLEEFVAAACAMECGLSNPLKKQIRPGTFAEDDDADLDMDRHMLTALVKFCEEIPRPVRVMPEEQTALQQVQRGDELFASIGCAVCHTPDIGNVKGVYSDFLLHVIEDSYDENYRSVRDNVLNVDRGHPHPNEWKTPPLWGVADSAPYWHDGSAPTLADAISKHGRQAEKVTAQYEELKQQDQEAIIAFLKTLRAPQPVAVR